MRLSSRGFMALLPLAVLPSTPYGTSAPAGRALDGYVIAMQITSSEANSRGPTTLTLKVAGDKMRVEMDLSGTMGGGGGGRGGLEMGGAFMLLQPDGKVAMILPEMANPLSGGMGFGMVLDLASLQGGGRGGRGGRGVPADATDIQVTVDDLGAGEAILGHATRKYRIHETYALGSGGAQESTTESWFATDLAGAEEGFRKFSESFGAQFGSGNASKSLVDAKRAKMPKGFPLKSITTTAKPDGKTTTTMEATKVGKMSFDASDFEVPAGIQVMDLGAMMGGRGRGGN